MRKAIFTRLFFISFIIFTGIIDSSAQQCIWAKSAGGDYTASPYAIATDASGNVYVGGSYNSDSMIFGTTSIINPFNSTQNMFIAKYDSLGNVQWAKTFGNGGPDGIDGLTVDAFGNLYATASIGSPVITIGTTTINNPTGNALALIKLTSSGAVTWVRSAEGVGGTSPDGIGNLATDLSGNIFIVGSFTGSLVFGSVGIENFNTVGAETYLVKYDPLGNVLWAKQSHTGGYVGFDEAGVVATDMSGNVYITGGFGSDTMYFDSLSITNPIPVTTSMIFLAKYDPSGNPVWAKSAGDSGVSQANSLAIDDSGSIYITGSFESPQLIIGSITLNNADAVLGTDDIFLAKYSAGGIPVWAARAGGTDGDYPAQIVLDGAGYLYITGQFLSSSLSFGTTTLSNSGIFLAKYTAAEGDPVMAKESLVADANSWAAPLAKDNFGHIYVAGAFDSPIKLDSIALSDSAAPNYDIFLAKYGYLPSGIATVNMVGHDFNIYPNPTNNRIIISGTDNITNVTIFNVSGQTVYDQGHNATMVQINIAYLPAGMYFVKVNGTTAMRFEKE